jgi:hypothetical protein
MILRRYLPWLAGLNLAWEIAQLPLYTIWIASKLGVLGTHATRLARRH